MAREKGEIGLSGAFEPQSAKPLDARMIVPTYAELVLAATWTANDGSIYAYSGMLVNVYNDPDASLNGVYKLNALPYSTAANWELVGGGQAGAGLTKTGNVFSLGDELDSEISFTFPSNISTIKFGIGTPDFYGIYRHFSTEFSRLIGIKTFKSTTVFNDLGFALRTFLNNNQTSVVWADQAANGTTLYLGISGNAKDTYFEIKNFGGVHSIILHANSDFKGIEYEQDYSPNYTNRSLVDKEYVDSKVSSSFIDILIFG